MTSSGCAGTMPVPWRPTASVSAGGELTRSGGQHEPVQKVGVQHQLKAGGPEAVQPQLLAHLDQAQGLQIVQVPLQRAHVAAAAHR